jgi:hypothetical protein
MLFGRLQAELVLPGLDPGITLFFSPLPEDVGGRIEAGQDEARSGRGQHPQIA